MAIVLELLSRKNIPLKHYKFEQDYVCVGRDFNNDLRLDDPYVCPSHMLVAIDPESGKLIVNDCQSTNGMKVNGKAVNQALLSAHDIIKIGRTRLRIIDTKVPLPQAMPLSELEENLSWMNKVSLVITLSMLCIGSLLLGEYVNTVEEFNLIQTALSQLGQLAVICIWPIGIAILAKVVKKESHLINQINLTLLASLLVFALGLLKKVFVFNVQPSTWFNWFELLVFSAIVVGYIWLSLFIGFHQPNKRRNLLTGALCILIIAPILVLGFLRDDEFSNLAKYNPTLLAPIYNITGSVSSEKFIDRNVSLFDTVDKLSLK